MTCIKLTIKIRPLKYGSYFAFSTQFLPNNSNTGFLENLLLPVAIGFMVNMAGFGRILSKIQNGKCHGNI